MSFRKPLPVLQRRARRSCWKGPKPICSGSRATCSLRYRRAAARQASRHVTIDHALDVAIPPDQAWAIEADDARQRYLAAIDALSPRTREIFLRSRVDGRTYSEIAQEMSVSVKAIEYHMGRALAHLYQAFYGE